MTLVDAETGEIMPFAEATLEECEAVIERGLSSFVEVGNALVAIREGHKYRKTHKTFEAYCTERWSLSRARAYQLIDAAEVVDVMSNMLDTPMPSNARQAAALAPLKDDPQAMADAMRSVAQRTEGKPTAKKIEEAVADVVAEEMAKVAQRTEDREAISDLSAAVKRAGLDTDPDRVRQRGEFSRLCRDIASLPDPVAFIAHHGEHLRDRHGNQAVQAHEWLSKFCDEWSNR